MGIKRVRAKKSGGNRKLEEKDGTRKLH